jgi:hypothetical protein
LERRPVQNCVLPKSLAKPVLIDAEKELKKQTPKPKSLAKKLYPTYIPGYKESVQKVPEIFTNSYLDNKISVVSHIFLN